MADVKQIYEVVNSIAEQSLGIEGLTATDASFVDVGKAVLSSEENIDAWYKTLIDRIGRTVISMREYKGLGDDLKREPFEYGAILQKLNVKLPTATTNTSWNDADDDATNPYTKTEMTVRQKFFSIISTWEVDGTIPDVQLKTAFTSPQAMGAFIDAIFLAMNNSLELSYQNVANLCRSSFIARKSLSETGNGYINLLSLYNETYGQELTVDTCRVDKDFLRFCTMTISLYVDRMQTMSTLFNDEEYERHTPKDLLVVKVLSEFAKAFDVYLSADTYHNEMVKLPKYSTVPFWQGSGTGFGFDDTSAISVDIDTGESDLTTVELSGIVAVLHDFDAMGVTIQNKRTRSIYNPKDEYTNYFAKVDMGYFNDMSENGVVFYIADDTDSDNTESDNTESDDVNE